MARCPSHTIHPSSGTPPSTTSPAPCVAASPGKARWAETAATALGPDRERCCCCGLRALGGPSVFRSGAHISFSRPPRARGPIVMLGVCFISVGICDGRHVMSDAGMPAVLSALCAAASTSWRMPAHAGVRDQLAGRGRGDQGAARVPAAQRRRWRFGGGCSRRPRRPPSWARGWPRGQGRPDRRSRNVLAGCSAGLAADDHAPRQRLKRSGRHAGARANVCFATLLDPRRAGGFGRPRGTQNRYASRSPPQCRPATVIGAAASLSSTNWPPPMSRR